MLIAILAGIFTYLVVFKLLFEDSAEFFIKLKRTALYLPLEWVLDYFFNWSPSEPKLSWKMAVWLLSGFAVGVITYHYLR
jgi:hypothetical protein